MTIKQHHPKIHHLGLKALPNAIGRTTRRILHTQIPNPPNDTADELQ